MNIYCSNCGGAQKGHEKFCAKCGQALIAGIPSEETKDTKASKKKNGFLNTFNISDEELKLQIEKHDVLPFSKSSRGIAVLTILALLAIGLTFVILINLVGSDIQISFWDVFWSLIIYIPLLYFTYKGHLWAIAGLGLYYTLDKFASTFFLSSSHFNVGAIFFWIIGIGPIWVAFRVEREYRKNKMLNAVS